MKKLILPLLMLTASPAFASGGPFLSLHNSTFVVALAFIIFVMVRQMNRLMHHEQAAAAPAAPAPTPEDIVLLREIRDSLKNKG